MINSGRSKLIVKNWIKQSKEFNEARRLKAELEKMLEEECYNVLSEDEKRYIELRGIEYVKLQKSITSEDYSTRLSKIYGKSFMNFDRRNNLCGSWMYVDGNCKTIYEGFPEMSDITYIRVPTKTPFLFSPENCNEEEFKKEQQMYPEFFKKFNGTFKEYVKNLVALDKKVKELATVVFANNASLRIIKAEYEELYNLSK